MNKCPDTKLLFISWDEKTQRTQRVAWSFVLVCVCVTVERVRLNKCIWQDRWLHCVSSHIFSSRRGGGLYTEGRERKMEVRWVEERKEKLPVWISGLNIWWIEEYRIIPGAFKSHKVASSKSHNSSDSDSSFYLGPLRAGEADRDKGRGVFFLLRGCFYQSAFQSKNKHIRTEPRCLGRNTAANHLGGITGRLRGS